MALLFFNGAQQVPIQFWNIAVAEVAQRRPPSARIVFDTPKPVLDGVKVAAKRGRLVVAERQMLNRVIQKLQNIGKPAPLLRSQGRSVGQLQASFLERQQTHREIAAVDGGHISGSERLERPGVVPVEQMAAVPVDARECLEAVPQA